jgi:HD superfamily phosphohydrolase YqeK
METPKERFIRLLLSTQRNGVEALIDALEHSDWFVAPASSKYHCAYEGGLVDHSLAVYDELERLYSAYPELDIAEQSRTIVALLHDLCKIYTYTQVEKFRKNEFGQWEKYLAYEHNESYKFGGHGSKSVFLASRYITLTDTEAAAINCHMSTWEEGKVQEISQVFKVNPLAWLIHVADESATFIQMK